MSFSSKPALVSGSYRTIFGPCIRHAGVVFDESPANLAQALCRITNKRKPDTPGLHELLYNNQYKYVAGRCGKWGRFLDRFVHRTRNAIQFEYSELGLPLDCITEFCLAPHPKMRLRQSALKWILDGGCSLSSNFVQKGKMKYKMKKYEIAKPGKYARGIGDLTCPGSIRGGYLIPAVKHAFAAGHRIGQSFMEYIGSPDMDVLSRCFEQLSCPDGDGYFCYFSDDSCISQRCVDGVFMGNLDISSCDGSSFTPVFNLLRGMMENLTHTDSVAGVFDQCRLPVTVSNPQREFSKEKFVLAPKEHVLYSGSVLTTVINNLANSLIYMRFKFLLRGMSAPLRKCDVPALISKAAADVGYLVTIEVCDVLADLQFLKHSPHRTTEGIITPLLNLGVLFRSFGQFTGDLPGPKSLSISDRAKLFNEQVIKGYVHAGDHVILDAYRQKFDTGWRGAVFRRFLKTWDTVTSCPRIVGEISGKQRGRVDCSELAGRYRCSVHDIEEFLEMFSSATIGDVIQCKFTDLVDRKSVV